MRILTCYWSQFSLKFRFACQSEPCTDELNWLQELAHKQTNSSESVYGERCDNEQRKLQVVDMALCSYMPHFCGFFAY